MILFSFVINLVIYLVRPPGETTSQRDLGLADLVHEEDHPVMSCSYMHLGYRCIDCPLIQ